MSSGYHCFPYEHAHSAYFYCKNPPKHYVFSCLGGSFYLPDCGRNKTLRAHQTYDVVPTSYVNSKSK